MNMELGLGNTHLAGDPRLVDHIVGEVKSQGIFDQCRKECIADVDTKPAYQNLRTRVASSVNSFLDKQTWKADLNKNQLRETLRKHIVEAPYLDAGVERIVDQVVNPKVYSVFMPQIEDVVYKFLGLERPKNRQRNGPCGFKDLLPKDLDPVSPESDKNSLKDVSLDSVDAVMTEPEPRANDTSISSVEQTRKDEADNNSYEKENERNGNADIDEKPMDETAKSSTLINMNSSGKTDDKTEEEEEDSPTFEPIDIMNLNESNVSNDSHLSGISELTSHRSRSPEFSNDASRDNMDFSNQDSQLSKVSSDSRLSIVTDFGSSNHGSTPVSDPLKDDKNESKYPKDNFRAVREFETGKSNKDGKSSCESSDRSKENTPNDFKSIRRSFSSKETSRDGTESVTKDSQRNDVKSRKSDSKDSKKEREKDNRKKSTNNEVRSSDNKSSRKNVKDKVEDRSRERDKDREMKEPPKRDKIEGKEVKDLKDLYKEKIRELREKKELTEKEKLIRDKDAKASKDTKDKRDTSRDKRDVKDHKSSSSKSSSRSDTKNSKSSDANDSKSVRSESRDKTKRDDRRSSKDNNKSKTNNSQTDEKSDGRRNSRSDEKIDKTEMKETRKKIVVKKDGKNVDRRDSKSELDKDKKRREEKKTKAKDDHSSLRKNSEDRRSTDRDGSNGSNGRNSQKSGSSGGSSVAKSSGSNLTKESTNTSNSSSETSDSIEESPNEKLSTSLDDKNLEIIEGNRENDSQAKKLDIGTDEISLPIKKRPLGEIVVGAAGCSSDILMKKPKFAKNFHEAKRLMKIRRKMEKEKIRRQQELEKNVEVPTIPEVREIVAKNDDLELVPDDERVQIIEVCDEEYDEPYPEMQSDFTLEERSQIILGGESIFTSDLPMINRFNVKSGLSEMELSIRESLNEMISDKRVGETEPVTKTTIEELPIKTEPVTKTTTEELPIKTEPVTKTTIEELPIKTNDCVVFANDNLSPEIKDSALGAKDSSPEAKDSSPEAKDSSSETKDSSPDAENSPKTEESSPKQSSPPEPYQTEVVQPPMQSDVEEEIAEKKSDDEIITKNEEIGKDKFDEEIIMKNEEIVEKKLDDEIITKIDEIEENKSDDEIITKIEEIVENKSSDEIITKVEKIVEEKSNDEIITKIEEILEEKSNDEIITKIDRIVEKKFDDEIIAKNEEIMDNKFDDEIIMKNEEIAENKSNDEIITNNDEIVENKSNDEIIEKNDEIAENKSNDEIIEKNDEIAENKSNDEIIEKNDEIAENKSNDETITKNDEIAENKSNDEVITKNDEIVCHDEDSIIPEPPKATKTPESTDKDAENTESKIIEEKVERTNETIPKSQPILSTVTSSEISSATTIEAEPCDIITKNKTETCDDLKIDRRNFSEIVDDDPAYLSDDVPCLYFTEDNDRLNRFTRFVRDFEKNEGSMILELETIADASGSLDDVGSSVSKFMAPPKPKRKYSTSPLSDILLNNANNNNDAHKITTSMAEDETSSNTMKKRKLGRPKKQRSSGSLCGQSNLLNGENFVMPLSPESDVSATSEKTPSNPIKEEKSRPRSSSQRYTSDDLYKPRPLFASSSRRSRRSTQT